MPGWDYQEIFAKFRQLRIMVIGDVMVDAYIFGSVDRISPEAPVPVVSVEKRVNRLGGAANVALNLKSLGAEPLLCSIVGKDAKGKEFFGLLDEAGITGKHILTSSERLTTAKFRVFGNKSQMLRVDEEVTHDLNEADQSALLDMIFSVIDGSAVDAIVFQDYNKGILTSELITKVIEKAKSRQIPVAVDPKKKNFLAYRDVTLFKPNLKELREGLRRDINGNDLESLEAATAYLHRELGINIIMTTLSEHGVFISRKEPGSNITSLLIPAHLRNIADVSGAGDTVISVAALCLAVDMDTAGIASLSNLAGGLVCEEVGVVPVNRDKLLNECLKLF